MSSEERREENKRRIYESLYLISFVCADINGEEIYFDGRECFFEQGGGGIKS